MPVDKIELAKDLANPEYQELVKTELSKQKFVIRDEATEKTFLENYAKNYEETTIKSKIAAVHGQYEKDIAEVFPDFKRNEQESTYDALKRIGKAKVGEYSKKIQDLEEQIKKGDPTGALSKKLEETEARAKEAIDKLNKELGEYKQKTTLSERQNAVTTIYGDLKQSFNKVKPALFERTEKAILDEAMANSGPYEHGGKTVLVMLNPDGSPRKDAMFNPILVSDWLKNEFKDVIDPKYVQGGGGSNPKPGGADPKIDPATITADTFILPEGIKDRDSLITHMLELGIKRMSPAWNAIYAKYKDKLPTFAATSGHY